MTVRAMNVAAAIGRLDIVQRLFATRSEGCPIEAFARAAANGHLEVLQWLRQHYPKLYVSVLCLVRAVEYGHADVVRLVKQDLGIYINTHGGSCF